MAILEHRKATYAAAKDVSARALDRQHPALGSTLRRAPQPANACTKKRHLNQPRNAATTLTVAATTDEEAALVQEIEAAFEGVILDDGISLNMTEYYDSGGTSEDYAERAIADEREDWRRIPDDTLERFTVTFCFTDLKGFRFYLPAYMRWTVRNHRESDCIIGDSTICALSPTHYIFAGTKFSEWFTKRQFAVILRFLSFAAANDDTLDARVAARCLAEFEASES